MRAFSACIKIMKRRKASLLVYFSVFAFLLLSMIFFGDSSMYGDFEEKKPNYAFLNRDGESALAAGLEKVLGDMGTCVELEDSKEVLMDAGFYGAVDCIFIIPEGYGEGFQNGEETALQMWQWPSSSTGYYLKAAAEQYLTLAKMYRDKGGMSCEEAARTAADSMELETEVTVRRYTDGAAVSDNVRFWQRFLPYILLLMSICEVSIVFMPFKRVEIHMRNLCSPVKPVSIAQGKLLYAFVVGIGTWIVTNLMGIAVVWRNITEMDARLCGLYFLNSFGFMLVAVSAALLCSVFVSGETVMSFVTNIVSLIMCFLGGVFVPLEMLGDGLLKVAKFDPVYWYEENEGRISGLTGFTRENLQPVYRDILIQVGFAVAFFCIYLLISKYQQQAEESFGTVKTEIEQ